MPKPRNALTICDELINPTLSTILLLSISELYKFFSI
jgi:hypothetical protein